MPDINDIPEPLRTEILKDFEALEPWTVPVIPVTVRTRCALWPGDGVFCVLMDIKPLGATRMTLHDRDERVSELLPYRFGMFGIPASD